MSVGFKLLLSKKSAEQAAVLNENKVMDKKKKFKLLNEKTICWMHMQLLHKQLAIGYKTEI